METMVNGGWVKLYRELKSKSIWQLSSPQQKVVLITILLLANHEENKWEWKGEQFVCKPGQLITSLNSLVKECGDGVTMQNVRTALERFEKLGFLKCESTASGRLITIINWDIYQGKSANKASNKAKLDFFENSTKQLTMLLTKHGVSENIAKSMLPELFELVTNKDANKDANKRLTNEVTKQLTTNKNNKEYKNDKEIYNKRFEPPSVDDVIDYCKERNNNVDAQAFIDFYTSKDWMIGKNKMRDWKAAVRSWERNQTRKEETAKHGNAFNNFESRSYDMDSLERQLLE